MKRLIPVFLALFLVVGCEMTPEGKLAKGLKDPNPEVRKETAIQLGDLGTAKALQLLQLHEDDPDFRTRDTIREAIKKINKQTFMK
ncbi:MAG: HEAT repeat domain-containing protein [Candidatus Riflebacteria bacterium]|nr:HEAT repeat domain-containing protein [Candidatus Riflebacteria bacterium]